LFKDITKQSFAQRILIASYFIITRRAESSCCRLEKAVLLECCHLVNNTQLLLSCLNALAYDKSGLNTAF